MEKEMLKMEKEMLKEFEKELDKLKEEMLKELDKAWSAAKESAERSRRAENLASTALRTVEANGQEMQGELARMAQETQETQRRNEYLEFQMSHEIEVRIQHLEIQTEANTGRLSNIEMFVPEARTHSFAIVI